MKTTDFRFMEDLLRRESGLNLTPEKSYLLETRLPPVAAAYGIEGLDRLIDVLRANDRLQRAVVEAMTTNETSFFRDVTPFTHLRERLLPYYAAARAKQKYLRIWSAACATGQEPYSIAMQLRESAALFEGWKNEIFASDLSEETIARARTGIYSQFDVQRGLPVRLLVKYFTRDHEKWRLCDAVRDMVSFRPVNLLAVPQGLGLFDIIFCRNVLMYFGMAEKTRALQALHAAMRVDSVLLLGGAEAMPAVPGLFRPLAGASGVFVRSDSNLSL